MSTVNLNDRPLFNQPKQRYYYVDTTTETVKQTFLKESVSTAYKKYFWTQLKPAKEFLKNIYKTHFDVVYNCKEYNNNLDKEYNARVLLKKIEERIYFLEDQLKDYYPEGFKNSDEWKERQRLNLKFQKEKQHLRSRELDVFEILYVNTKKAVRNRHSQYGFNHKKRYTILNAPVLGGGLRFINSETKKASLEYQKDKLDMHNRIYRAEIKYINYHNKTKLPRQQADYYKNKLLTALEQFDIVQKRVFKYTLYNMYLNGTPHIEKIKLSELTLDKVQQTYTTFNLITLTKNKGLPTPIDFIYERSDRLKMVSEEGRLLVNNSDIILYKGNLTDLIGGNLLPFNFKLDYFKNEQEIKFSKPPIKKKGVQIDINREFTGLEALFGRHLYLTNRDYFGGSEKVKVNTRQGKYETKGWNNNSDN